MDKKYWKILRFSEPHRGSAALHAFSVKEIATPAEMQDATGNCVNSWATQSVIQIYVVGVSFCFLIVAMFAAIRPAKAPQTQKNQSKVKPIMETKGKRNLLWQLPYDVKRRLRTLNFQQHNCTKNIQSFSSDFAESSRNLRAITPPHTVIVASKECI